MYIYTHIYIYIYAYICIYIYARVGENASAVERIWQMEDSQGHNLALTCRLEYSIRFRIWP